jgi:hypothetical protein
LCKQPPILVSINSGVIDKVQYQYLDRHQQPIMTIEVVGENCSVAKLSQIYVEQARAFEDTIRQTRATLPQRLDNVTTLVGIGLNGKTYWMRSVVDLDGATLDENTKRAIRQDLTEGICQGYELKNAMNVGLVDNVQSQLIDRNNNPIMMIEVGKNDCR